ncbi:hypothetical protein K8374_15185 [Pseudomonas sp. p1(2021b)]|uniref:hypothetical protein n=1 Tax=Pseudomonas sp. p1(2021b) TaxID=2874628 RepID=UPI001CCC45FC|nr:hypothetical protein [Pseudomonas sp. p1(2021b)]UBM23736.1 hypothetical protein K8374_15185 [Pseudomonas sp. p1(2021b)]
MNDMLETALPILEHFQDVGGPTSLDLNAMFGAMLGAWLVSSSRRRLRHWGILSNDDRLKVWQRMVALALAGGVGYLFTPFVLSLVPSLSSGVAAFVAALVVIPISIKVMHWVDHADLQDIIRRWRKGG